MAPVLEMIIANEKICIFFAASESRYAGISPSRLLRRLSRSFDLRISIVIRLRILSIRNAVIPVAAKCREPVSKAHISNRRNV